MFRFAISNAFRRKGIAFFAILGTALGITLMTVLLSISDGMELRMNETMKDLAGGIGVYPEDAPAGFMIPGGTPFPISYVEDIEGIDHVETVAPVVLAFIPTEVADFGDPLGVSLKGVDLARDAESGGPTAPANIIEGRTIAGENEIILGSFLYTYSRGAWNIDDKIVLLGSGELTVVGIFETGNNFFDMSIYSDIDTARSLVPGISSDEVNYIEVGADSTETVEAVAAEIEAMFEDSKAPVQTIVATKILGQISSTMNTFQSFLWVISLVAGIAGGISIFIVMLISVIERTKEFGILKASGWSNGNIIGSVGLQSITIALLGAAVGLTVGYLAGLGIDSYLTVDIAVVTWRLVLTIAAFGILVGVVGGLYPALRAAWVSPIESMRAL